MIDNSSLYDQYCFNSSSTWSLLLGQSFWIFSPSFDNTRSSAVDLLISSKFVPVTSMFLYTMWIWAANSSSDISQSISFREALDSELANTILLPDLYDKWKLYFCRRSSIFVTSPELLLMVCSLYSPMARDEWLTFSECLVPINIIMESFTTKQDY